MNSEKVIEIIGLTKKFKNLTAVNNLNLNVYKGDVFGFLGPNGAGKSTTIRMLLTLIKPTSGKIKIFGKDLIQQRKEILAKVGAIVEKPDFYLYLTAYKNLEILGKMSGISISQKNIMEILELVGLDKRYNSKVKTFSHGMKQRLGIAQTLLHNPELIILDEPTTGLDPQGMKEIRDLIIFLSKEKGKTIFLSSHILREIELIANRMVIINKGQNIIEGEVKQLLNDNEQDVEIKFKSQNDVKEILTNSIFSDNISSVLNTLLKIKITEEKIPQLIKTLVESNVEIYSVEKKNSLEDYFLKITEDK
ncbi:MAG: ABC transporter ATP-binding protein [Ignavibacteriales bacterium]|nr:ABC transporter ATP-binding protein [Ignavibacteriales bacterium]